MAIPLFAPRRSAASFDASLPRNTRLGGASAGVIGAQPPSFARGREVAALLLWTFAAFTSLALASYAGDPAHLPGAPLPPGEAPVVSADWVGPVGAWVAQAFVSAVGVAAWVVPVEAVVLGVPFVRGKKSEVNLPRLAGDLLLVLLFASLVQVGWPGELAFGKHTASGAVGELFGEVMRALFSTAGSFLVGFACAGLVLIGRASFSFIALLKLFARLGLVSAERTKSGAQRVHGAWQKARELERRRAEEARAADAPHIERGAGDDAIVAILPPPGEDDDDALAEAFAPTPSPALVEAPAEPEKKPRRKRAAAGASFGPPGSSPVGAGFSPPGSPPVGAGFSPPGLESSEAQAVADALEASPDPSEVAPAPKRAKRPTAAAVVAADAAAADGPKPAPTTTKAKKPADEPVGITIVDTSAALEKEEASEEEVEAVQQKAAKRAKGFELPPIDFLEASKVDPSLAVDEEALRRSADLLVKTLADYKVSGKVEEILPGPVVTTFEVSPVAGTKVSKVAALADDLALALAKKVRIVAPIPGKNRIGFELPNEKRLPVNLRDLVEDRRFQTLDAPLPVVLGRDIVGNPVYADLASMPHTIVAGATGAGKSVGLNVMLCSLLYRRTPEELRMLMIDPKVVELAPFDRIPHMLLPVVTDMKQASLALKWAVDEMERRYQLFADAGTKNIGTYNAWVKKVRRGEAQLKLPLPKMVVAKDHNGLPETIPGMPGEGEVQLPDTLPMIVIVVDEFADLMMQQGKDVEAAVARLAQKARAAGMHVILATQRPSVDVITGMIKANFPTRVAFRVAQKVDSRTILDEQGAEHLLGKGDMLIKLNGTNDTRRVQCPWVSEEEVQLITDHLRAQGEPVYDENILKPRDDEGGGGGEDEDAEQDSMYDDAVRIVAETRRCSTSWLQRKLGLGYNRAARIVETMERRGLVGPANGSKDREVLIDPI